MCQNSKDVEREAYKALYTINAVYPELISDKATQVQKMIRGYQTRKRLELFLENQILKDRVAYFDSFAIKIQKL
jgi:hypothetical protein